MPPKVQYAKEDILNAAFTVVREMGVENLNARTVAKKMGCSTQPIMYHFKTIEELKQEVYKKADAYHTEYLMDIRTENPLLDIGMNYIRFAAEEKFLFQFLFRSDGFSGRGLSDLIEVDELAPIFDILTSQAQVDMDRETAQEIFRCICMTAHGYASMLANNRMHIGENVIAADLEKVFIGAFLALEKDKEQKRT